jgi:hypothetical protein
MPARIATVKKAESSVEDTQNDNKELSLAERVAYLEERNLLLEKKVLAPDVAEVSPDDCHIVHRIPSYVEVNGMMTLTHKEVRIPLSENEAYEKANGLR